MKWYIALTSIGSMIFKAEELPVDSINQDCQKIYDACMVVQRPEIYYGLEEDKFNPVFTKKEAIEMNFIYKDQELQEVEGDIIDDYIPIKKDSKDGTNKSYYNPKQTIICSEIEDQEKLSQYIDFLLGRTEYQKVEAKTLQQAEIHEEQ